MEGNELFSRYDIIGRSMCKYLENLKELLSLDSTVLITGETGTGKELVARWIHFMDEKRRDKPFVKITIPNIGENIFESEVFGYEKGAFTGAISAKKGLIEVAQEGTVFMDEIENATPSVQSKLLQLLEDRIYRKVGGTEYFYSEARFLVATNIDLSKEVTKGNFRGDLFYRLSVLDIRLPSLSERGDDILEIANYYIDKFNKKLNKNIKYLEKESISRLLSYSWPGNVRELRNFIEKSMVFCRNDELDLKIPKNIDMNNRDFYTDYKSYINIMERDYIEHLYNLTNGRVEEMAKHMNMSVPFVYKKMKEHGIT